MLALSGFIYITGGFTLRNIQSCESRLSCCKQRKCGAAFFLIKLPKMFLFLNAYNTMNLDMIPSAVTDNTECVTSLEIAEITGKEHKNVMRDIRNILEQGVNQLNFELKLKISDLGNGRKREDPYYSLTPKGCLILASGYNVLLREKIINRLETLEKRNIPSYQEPDPIRRAELWIAEQKEKRRLMLENQQQQQELQRKDTEIVSLAATVTRMRPKVSYVDMVLQCKETVSTTQIAQDYGMSAKAFNILLRNHGIQHKVSGQWILYSRYLPCGYVQSDTIDITHTNGTRGVVMHTKWTQRGRLFLYDTLKHHGTLPLVETAQTGDNSNL